MAQGLTIHGKVVDAKNEPVVGASVVVKKDSSRGTTTNINGAFTLSGIDRNATLQVSFIGFKTQEVAVGGRTELNIVLEEDSKLLDDIVIVGYGTQKKVNLSGSVAALDPK